MKCVTLRCLQLVCSKPIFKDPRASYQESGSPRDLINQNNYLSVRVIGVPKSAVTSIMVAH